MKSHSEIEIVNARIDAADLNFGQRRMLIPDLAFDYGGSFQGAFQIRLRSDESDIGGWFVERLLQTLEADSWLALHHVPVRIKRGKGPQGEIIAVGHFIKDQWFNPSEELDEKGNPKAND